MAQNVDARKLERFIRELTSKHIRIGWVDGNGTAVDATRKREYRKATGKKTPGEKREVSNALIARTLNYGREAGETLGGHKYPAIPARPFLSLAAKNFAAKMPKISRKYLTGILNGRVSADALRKELGQRGADEIKTAMTEGHWAPLSPVTLQARRNKDKSSAKPLIDTGNLRQTCSFEIV